MIKDKIEKKDILATNGKTVYLKENVSLTKFEDDDEILETKEVEYFVNVDDFDESYFI